MKHIGLIAMSIVVSAAALPGQQTPSYWITPEEARELERRIALPISPFFDTPDPLPAGKPGDLIRSEEFGEYTFPFPYTINVATLGLHCVRFLYRSRAIGGNEVPASGVVLVPYGTPPSGGWPVVVWAHGTSGVGRQFAPSLMKDLYYSWQGFLQWAMLGYAVIAPDYAGLGTNVRHQYLALPAQAQDLINAVPAARRAVPQLGSRWVAVGHSQGAGAVIALAELQAGVRDSAYLGAVAMAAPGDLEPVVERMANSENEGYLAFLAYGIKSVYPEFMYRDLLTPAAADLMPVVNDGGWYVTLATFAQRIPVGKMLRPDWKENAYFQRYRKLALLGAKPAYGPVLLIQGLADATIPTGSADALYGRMIQQQSVVKYVKYPGLDHDPIVFGSFRDQVQWVQDRFADRSASGK